MTPAPHCANATPPTALCPHLHHTHPTFCRLAVEHGTLPFYTFAPFAANTVLPHSDVIFAIYWRAPFRSGAPPSLNPASNQRGLVWRRQQYDSSVCRFICFSRHLINERTYALPAVTNNAAPINVRIPSVPIPRCVPAFFRCLHTP